MEGKPNMNGRNDFIRLPPPDTPEVTFSKKDDEERELELQSLTTVIDGGKEKETQDGYTFDDILHRIGHFGRFQKHIVVVLVLLSWSVGYQNMSPVFTLNIPKHRCEIPGLTNDTYRIQNVAHEQTINDSIPRKKDGGFRSCSMYIRVPAENGSASYETEQGCTTWVYDKSVFERTLTTDLNLVCDRKILRSHSSMILFAGKFIGAILQGFASDAFGRRTVLIVSALGILATAIGNALVTSTVMLFVFRFFTGMMTTAGYLAVYVLAIEYMGPAHRARISFTNRLSFTLGQLTLTPIAYFQNDWRVFQLIIIWPSILTVLLLWMIPESSRWLLTKNKREAAEKTMQKAARLNSAHLPSSMMSELRANQDSTSVSPLLLFQDVRLVVRWIVLYVNWMVISMVYYGLTLNISNLGGNIFLNFFLLAVADVAATIMTGLVVEKISRKYFFFTVMLIGGSACALTFIPVIAGFDTWVVVLLSMIGKMAISSAFFLVYTYTAELFPTSHRAFGIGSASMMARIGGIACPYVADLNTYIEGGFGEVLPQLVFGASGIIGGLLTLLLPETRNRKLPETIADVKNFHIS